MRLYYYRNGTEVIGPYFLEELLALDVNIETLIWTSGMKNWVKARDVSEIYSRLLYSGIQDNIQEEIEFGDQNVAVKTKSRNRNSTKRFRWLGLGGAVVISATVFVYVCKSYNQNALYNSIVERSYDSEEDFEFYVEKFYRDLSHYGIRPVRPEVSIIRFSNLEQIKGLTHVHGISYGLGDAKTTEIYINPNSWNSFSKPMKYLLIYHELSHDVLDLEDLLATESNMGRLMYPEISRYDAITMDDFIEAFHEEFENYTSPR